MRITTQPAFLAVLLLSSAGQAAAFLTPSRANQCRNFAAVVRSTQTDEEGSVASTLAAETPNPRQYGLALQLDDGTRKSHSVAENTAFVTGFFKGISKPESYRNLLTSLYYVYKAMEEDAFDNTQDGRVKVLDDRELRRLNALQKDMSYFYGGEQGEWKNQIPAPTPATKKYVARIQQLISNPNESYLLIAHQYTRYLGDLFGGQMMGGMAQRTMKLPDDGSGVAFYQFDSIDSTKDYITNWYQRLNDLDLTKEQKEKIVDEANLVFELNIGILEELEGSPLTALWSMAVSSLKEKLGL